MHESECFGVIDVDSGKSILIPPTLDPSYVIWDGKLVIRVVHCKKLHSRINDEAWFKSTYEVDQVVFNKGTTIKDTLHTLNAKTVLLLVCFYIVII